MKSSFCSSAWKQWQSQFDALQFSSKTMRRQYFLKQWHLKQMNLEKSRNSDFGMPFTPRVNRAYSNDMPQWTMDLTRDDLCPLTKACEGQGPTRRCFQLRDRSGSGIGKNFGFRYRLDSGISTIYVWSIGYYQIFKIWIMFLSVISLIQHSLWEICGCIISGMVFSRRSRSYKI